MQHSWLAVAVDVWQSLLAHQNRSAVFLVDVPMDGLRGSGGNVQRGQAQEVLSRSCLIRPGAW